MDSRSVSSRGRELQRVMRYARAAEFSSATTMYVQVRKMRGAFSIWAGVALGKPEVVVGGHHAPHLRIGMVRLN